MKDLDYDLIEKIGATHYRVCDDNFVDYYKVDANGEPLCYSKDAVWNESISTIKVILTKVKPIPPRSEPEYEYIRVEDDSIFDLKVEFENGELYWEQIRGSGNMPLVASEARLIEEFTENNLYRRVEKPKPDWRDEVDNFCRELGCFDVSPRKLFIDESFLAMCRVALRATGELK